MARVPRVAGENPGGGQRGHLEGERDHRLAVTTEVIGIALTVAVGVRASGVEWVGPEVVCLREVVVRAAGAFGRGEGRDGRGSERKVEDGGSQDLRAWFITPETRMTPNLEFSQGLHGVSTGRSYGIIDTLHLVEVARAASLIPRETLTPAERNALHTWFADYLHWMKTSEKGVAERKTVNNHAICWALQAAEFARLIGDNQTRGEVREQYRNIFVPGQLGLDGSFPGELARTKPYSYSIFNFDVMAMLCQCLAGSGDDLFAFTLPDGRGMCRAASFIAPYLANKAAWPYKRDVEHFESLPVRSPSLLFSGLACSKPDYLRLWQTLNPDPTDPEIIRNYPVRQPLLWFPQAVGTPPVGENKAGG